MLIDTHVHIGRCWAHQPAMTVDGMLRWMDEHAVDRAVVLPLESPEASSFLIPTDTVLQIASRHPDRFIPFAVIDPRAAMRERDLRPVLEEYIASGARGFGEHKVGLPIDDPRSQTLYGIAGDLGLPVLLHMDGERNTDTVGLPGLERTLRKFPGTTFIGHAPAWWSSISGDCTFADLNGYPSGPVTPGGAVDRLLGEYANMWADLSAGSGAQAISRDLAYGEAFLERHHEKLLFATDYLFPGQEVPQFELMERVRLSDAAREAITHGNAERLLRI